MTAAYDKAPSALVRARDAYSLAMGYLYLACVWIAGISMLIISIIIPINVFMRYVMSNSMSWPEPMAVCLVIVFTFFAGAVCYRSGMHIAVMLFINLTHPALRFLLGLITEVMMITFNFFVLIWGFGLVETTWHQYIADFPILSVGLTYLPLPIGGGVTVLFIIERIWKLNFYPEPQAASEAPSASLQ